MALGNPAHRLLTAEPELAQNGPRCQVRPPAEAAWPVSHLRSPGHGETHRLTLPPKHEILGIHRDPTHTHGVFVDVAVVFRVLSFHFCPFQQETVGVSWQLTWSSFVVEIVLFLVPMLRSKKAAGRRRPAAAGPAQFEDNGGLKLSVFVLHLASLLGNIGLCSCRWSFG